MLRIFALHTTIKSGSIHSKEIAKKGTVMKFWKGALIFIAGTLTTVLIFVLIGMLNQDNLTPQERRYQSCLETVYQGYGENKITMDSDKATAADRLSMKKYCLCISDTEATDATLQKKVDDFVKKHNGTQPSAAEYDVLAEEVASERNTFCNKEGNK